MLESVHAWMATEFFARIPGEPGQEQVSLEFYSCASSTARLYTHSKVHGIVLTKNKKT